MSKTACIKWFYLWKRTVMLKVLQNDKSVRIFVLTIPIDNQPFHYIVDHLKLFTKKSTGIGITFPS